MRSFLVCSVFFTFCVLQNLALNTYLITSPSTIVKGKPFSVGVQILNSTEPVTVKAQLLEVIRNGTKTKRVVIDRSRAVFNQDVPGHLTLELPQNSLVNGEFSLKVRGRHGLSFESEKTLTVHNQQVSGLIQSDKAMYKAGQTVNFRIVTVRPDLKPSNEMINIDIHDPKNNWVKKYTDLVPTNGVVTESFLLSDEPNSGLWMIKVTIPYYDSYSFSQSFKVQNYELPKFEVKVELNPFGLYSDTELHGTVKADYTFGKPVSGMVDLRAYKGDVWNRCGNEEKSVQQVFPIEDGKATFTYSIAQLRKTLSVYGNMHKVKIVAKVTEKVTGKTLNGTGEIKFYSETYKLQFLSTSANTFKPGLPYKAYVKVTKQDDTPVTDVRQVVEVYTCVKFVRREQNQHKYACQQFEGTYNLATLSLNPDENGIVTISYDEIPFNTTQLMIKAWFMNRIQVSKTVYNANSPSDNYIQISTNPTTDAKVDQVVHFELKSTEEVETVYYMVKSRGTVGQVQKHDMGGMKESTMNLPVTSDMAPSSYILVYYIRANGEVVADGLTFQVSRLFRHDVSVSYNKEKATPQDSVNLVVSAEPDSTVFVLAVDQSVLLLSSGNDLTQSKVRSAMESYSQVPNRIQISNWYRGRQTSAKNPSAIFKEAGVIVITDVSNLYARQTYQPYGRRKYHSPGYGARGPPGPPAVQMATLDYAEEAFDISPERGSAGSLAEPERVRNIFPETWYWDNATVNADGKVTFSAKAPDTITSWVASAFGVDDMLGLGVAPTTSKLLVEKTFFISLNLPLSVKYGEVITIQAIVFNYLEQDLPVTVVLPKSSDYKNIQISGDGEESDISADQSSTQMIASGKPTPFYFPIRPVKRGIIDIQVKAKSLVAADAVERKLQVTPEGIRREKNNNMFVTADTDPDFSSVLNIPVPLNVVPDTLKVRVSVTGDIMGLSADNVENLIQLPTGCGEQNLMRFVPNIFVADYLTSTNQMPYVQLIRIMRYLELGYQRQLSFQRYDISYSPFGDSDSAGSVWLTSFVVRSFYQAKKYIYIDMNKLATSTNWILDRQSSDGSFIELGTIIDKHLQENTMSLTSYVLLTLLELDPMVVYDSYTIGKDLYLYKFGNVTEKATSYLESQIQTTEDIYCLAIATLALTRAKSNSADEAFQKLKANLRDSGDEQYLDVDHAKMNSRSSSSTSSDKPDGPRTSHDIISTAYALMTYIERGELLEGYKVMKFLVSQRNRRGGFRSSQDTIVALEALSRYATASRPETFLMMLDVESASQKLSFNVNSRNAMILQTKKLTAPIGQLSIRARGSGIAYLDISTEYYITDEDINDNFDISTVLLDDNINGFTLMTCCKVLNSPPTGMTTAKIQIPAGFDPDLSSVKVDGVKRVERSGSEVDVYFDKIGETSTCISLQASRSAMVSNTQKAFIEFTDYYQPNKRTTVSYLPRSLQKAKVCDVCKELCQ